MSANPFTVLSYVGGPALLTNASSLFVLSTSNRFARAIDRSRFLSEALSSGTGDGRWTAHYRVELVVVSRRLGMTARALTGFYFAAAMFALATLASIAGAVAAEFAPAAPNLIGVMAVACGLAGFAGFVTGAVSLVAESRLAMRSLARESEAAIAIATSGPPV